MIGGGLVLLNSLLSPFDVGWLKFNPSPYFLLPVLLGCRYGFAAGLLGGLLGAGIILLGRTALDGLALGLVLEDHGYFLACLALAGGLCGEIQRGYARRQAQMTALHQDLQIRVKQLDTDLELLRETKSELEGLLATRDSELSTLDSELRRLFDSDEEEFSHNLLLLLNRQLRITDAAIYWLQSNSTLKRAASLGNLESLPEQLEAQGKEMIGLALEHRTAVTLPELGEDKLQARQDYLMVVPFLDSKDEPIGVLAVTGMPFLALNRRTVQVTALICRWAARMLESRNQTAGAYRTVKGLEGQKIFSPEFFRQQLDLAWDSADLHGLPSFVVLFTAPAGAGVSQEHLETALMASVRGGDCPVVLDAPTPHLAVLLPLTGERGARIFVDRIRISCRADAGVADQLSWQMIKVDHPNSADDILRQLKARLAGTGSQVKT